MRLGFVQVALVRTQLFPGERQLRLDFADPGFQVLYPGALALQVPFALAPCVLHLFQFLTETTAHFLGVANGLLHPRDFRIQAVLLALNFTEAFRFIGMAQPQFFHRGLGGTNVGNNLFDFGLLALCGLFQRLRFLALCLPAQGQQLRLGPAFFFLQHLVVLGSARLTLQLPDPLGDLVNHVIETLQVLTGMADPVLGLPAPFLVLGNAGSFLEIHTQFVRFRVDQSRDHALLDDCIAVGAEAGTQKHGHDVLAPALHPVQKVFGLAVAHHLPAHRYLRVGGIFSTQPALAVVKDQFDRGLARRAAGRGAVEDHVFHRIAAQVPAAFTHHPADRINDVGFAAAVGSYNPHHGRREGKRGRVHERLEPGKFYTIKPHLCQFAYNRQPDCIRPYSHA